MNEKFGARIKRMRTEKQMGLRQTAKKVGISPTFLSRIENDQETSLPSEEKIKKLSEVLQDNFDELMQLAGRIPNEVTEYIKAKKSMPAFLRRAQEENISAEELMKLLDKRGQKDK